MKLSDLQDFFDGKICAQILHDRIRPEVLAYEKRCRVKGSDNPIFVTNDVEMTVFRVSIARLCRAHLDGELSEGDLGYIADALLLSNCAQDVGFLGEDLVGLVGELTDPEINGHITRETVLNVLIKLSAGQ